MNEITPESMVVLEPKPSRRGRFEGRRRVTPGDSSVLSVRIWAAHHDKLIQMAQTRDVSVAELVRQILGTVATKARR